MIIVSDTSVLIDLKRGDLLETIFALPPHQFAVPDVLFDREMQGEWGEHLRGIGLRVMEVSSSGVVNAQRYQQKRTSLSVSDSFALALAKEGQFLLLTGDGLLRELAGEESVECHGLLWLLDIMERLGISGFQDLHDGLTMIASHPRCRLPRREIKVRLERYQLVIKEN